MHSYSSRRQAPVGATVVLDTGSSLLRAGFAGEGMPRIVASMDGGRHVGSCAALEQSNDQQATGVVAQDSTILRQQRQAPFSIDWENLEATWEW